MPVKIVGALTPNGSPRRWRKLGDKEGRAIGRDMRARLGNTVSPVLGDVTDIMVRSVAPSIIRLLDARAKAWANLQVPSDCVEAWRAGAVDAIEEYLNGFRAIAASPAPG